VPEWALSGFVRKYEFDLLLGIIRGIDQFQMSDLHQAGAAVGVAFDSSADFNPVVEPLGRDLVDDLGSVDAAQVGDDAIFDPADFKAILVQGDR